MKILLRKLKPNPFRNFDVDPPDEKRIQMLTKSIKDDSFWEGIVCRKNKSGDFEIAFGHHRVEAAKRAGVNEATVVVADYDDVKMIRVMGRENATQRGNSGTAITGTVASALKYLLKLILTDDKHVGQYCPTSKSLEIVKAQALGKKGLGKDIIARFFEGIPGMNESAIKNQLTNLKLSGHYAKIAAEVAHDLKKAHKGMEEVADQMISTVGDHVTTFDFDGVSKYLQNDDQVRAFREIVTEGRTSETLPVENQELVAKELVRLAESTDHDLSRSFIQNNVIALAIEATSSSLSDYEKELLAEEAMLQKAANLQHDFCRRLGGMKKDAQKLMRLMEDNPGKIRISDEMRQISPEARRIIVQFDNNLSKLLDFPG